ncbi:hypothetical protein M440DRAFT_245276 [Trichoderma longibrachiatum ATCC 18648]|uniref:Uncharacterized protein n=1 Tax=Trichoderma longibrachiatum ATCC 18648 TaxID=983965 RepID=A0A2T4CDS7_TRILO|nr:hypothetical protein M440DRAFT_245276 [Trichoderma longibrachiatum ATCC 18648]
MGHRLFVLKEMRHGAYQMYFLFLRVISLLYQMATGRQSLSFFGLGFALSGLPQLCYSCRHAYRYAPYGADTLKQTPPYPCREGKALWPNPTTGCPPCIRRLLIGRCMQSVSYLRHNSIWLYISCQAAHYCLPSCQQSS